MSEAVSVTIRAADTDVVGNLTIEVGDAPKLHLATDDGSTFVAGGRDLFEAMTNLRRDLEQRGWLLMCTGARKDVYPSRMSRQMSRGRMAYVVRLGEPAGPEPVNIFDPAEQHLLATVAEQETFYHAWIDSLRALTVESPQPGEIDEAKKNPNGWVYRIASGFGRDAAVPPEAIIGAWRVDATGCIVGGFTKNAKYDPTKWPVRRK